jgi:hypothetical protein
MPSRLIPLLCRWIRDAKLKANDSMTQHREFNHARA